MSEIVKIEVPLLLPEVPDARDTCVHRLTERVLARPGVERVHLISASGEAPDCLCIHYDAHVLSLARIERLARQTGAKIGTRYGHVVWPLAGRSDQRAARALAERISRVPGVLDAAANAGGPLRIEFDREVTDEAALRISDTVLVKPNEQSGTRTMVRHTAWLSSTWDVAQCGSWKEFQTSCDLNSYSCQGSVNSVYRAPPGALYRG